MQTIFYKSDRVKKEKVSFPNQYKMNVAGNFYLPQDMKTDAKYPAIIVGYLMGAVKEQSTKRAAEPKELYIVPGAGHIDLYDWVKLIPFDKPEVFFDEYRNKTSGI